MKETYRAEFQAAIIQRATETKGKYTPVHNKSLSVNDIVLVKDPLVKLNNLPLAIVRKVIKNSIGEVTEAFIQKANKETIRRHVSSLIPVLSHQEEDAVDDKPPDTPPKRICRPRQAARKCLDKIRRGVAEGLI